MDRFCFACEEVVTESDPGSAHRILNGVMLCVCPACRRHARIGRAVEAMSPGDSLQCLKWREGKLWTTPTIEDAHETPLAALEAAGLVKEDDHG